MPITFHKDLIDIVETDITNLITNQVRENLNLEYKQIMYGNVDEDTREMLRDISSFANAQGGHILIGIREDNQDEGIPAEIIGIEGADVASERITSSCLNNIDERIPGLQTNSVSLNNGRYVLIVQIPKSPKAPHMITFKGLNQFWKRHDRQKSRMSVAEIKESCNATEQLMTKIEEFLKIRKTVFLERTNRKPYYFISATPYFVKDEVVDIYDPQIRDVIKYSPNQLRNGWDVICSDDVRPTLHGLISEIPEFASLQIFRNGHCEFSAKIEEEKRVQGYPILNSMAVVGYVVSFIRFYKKVFEYLNLIEPTIISINLFNIYKQYCPVKS